jgi:predicted amidohydrolase
MTTPGSHAPGSAATQHEPAAVRVAAVQFEARAIADVEEFYGRLDYFVRVAGEYRADFVVFPELFTLQLLACAPEMLGPDAAIDELTRQTPRFIAHVSALARAHRVNVVAGSHLTRGDDEVVRNVTYLALRDGGLHAQEKIHATPSERDWWGVRGGETMRAIPTDCGPVGVQICYDVEFPELGRKLADEGVKLVFTPFCTDTRQGYYRVRHCAQARAIENQCYVVAAGVVGNMPNVGNMDVHYARSGVFTPCDFRFPRDGVAEEAAENLETMLFADLDLGDIAWAREAGSVRNLADSRPDLYRLSWKNEG